MKIIRARVSGFCMGVRRAVNMANEAAAGTGGGVYTFGPLIHNARVLENLKKNGIKILDEVNINSVPPGSSVVIRAHGIPPEKEKILADKNIKILDATCPHVKVSQKKAEQYAGKGYCIFLAGEKDHAEIIGIRGYANSAAASAAAAGPVCIIAGNPAEARAEAEKLFRKKPDAKTVLIGQTTISPQEFKSIGTGIQSFFPNLEIVETICNSTEERRNALRDLCGETNAVIIAGSGESANTRRLLSLAREMGKPCWLVESPENIPREIRGYETIGIAAGASAPEELIGEIERELIACAGSEICGCA